MAADQPEGPMDGYRRVTAALRRVWKALRRRPRTSILAFAVFVLLVVPVYPFVPSCAVQVGFKYDRIFDRMTEEYRHTVKAHLKAYGVYYWDFGGIILLRTLPFLDGSEHFDQADAILNAEHKAAREVGGSTYRESFRGRKVDGTTYRAPPHIRALADTVAGDFDTGMCEFMYVAVTGKPAPPEYGSPRKWGE